MPELAEENARTSARERTYRQALRFYPARWRREHGAALISDLMDQDDARGRRRPSSGDRIALAWHGLGQRARAWSIAASVVGVAGLLLLVFATFAPAGAVWSISLHPRPGLSDPRWIPLVGGILVGSGVSATTLAIARRRGHLIGRAVAAALFGATAWGAGLLLGKSVPEPVFIGGDEVDSKWLPFGWAEAAHNTIAPASTIAGVVVTSVAVLALAGYVALTWSARRPRFTTRLTEASRKTMLGQREADRSPTSR